MKRLHLNFLVAICIVIYASRTSVAFTFVYMSENCDQTVSAGVGGLIEPAKTLTYPRNMNCTMTLSAAENHRLLLQFVRFDLEGAYSGVCVDKLNVYDGDSVDSSTLSGGDLCGNDAVPDMESSGTKVTFVMDSDDTGLKKGFGIVYTAYREDPCDATTEFRCGTGKCIASELECNNFENCDDGSDQEDCVEVPVVDSGLTAGQILGIAVGALLLIGVVVAAAYFGYQNKKQQRLTKELMKEKTQLPSDNVYSKEFTGDDFWGKNKEPALDG